MIVLNSNLTLIINNEISIPLNSFSEMVISRDNEEEEVTARAYELDSEILTSLDTLGNNIVKMELLRDNAKIWESTNYTHIKRLSFEATVDTSEYSIVFN